MNNAFEYAPSFAMDNLSFLFPLHPFFFFSFQRDKKQKNQERDKEKKNYKIPKKKKEIETKREINKKKKKFHLPSFPLPQNSISS